MQEKLFEPARAEGVARIEQNRGTKSLAVDRQRRAVEIFSRERDASVAEIRKLRKEAETAMARVDRAVRDAVQDEIADFQRDIEALVATLSRTNLDDLPEAEAHERQREIERDLDQRLEAGRELMAGVRDQLMAVAEAVTKNDDLEETAAALERRNVELQDRLGACRQRRRKPLSSSRPVDFQVLRTGRVSFSGARRSFPLGMTAFHLNQDMWSVRKETLALERRPRPLE